MLVHRFIGLSEIEALLNDGVVNPLAENKRDCLYIFDSDENEFNSFYGLKTNEKSIQKGSIA